MTPPEGLGTLDEHGSRLWVYPAAVQGVFMRWRKAVGYFVIAVFFVMPWININGMQSIWLQIPERRFVLFGTIFWAQDVFYMVFVLLGLAMALFFFTALAGRIWCGWLCPQTVFMEEIFRKIEEWVEGNHHQRRRLDAAPWSLGKLARKVFKHWLFLLFSAAVSNTFLAYFVGLENILVWMTRPPLAHWTAFLFMFVILALFYFDFAWFREQFCIALCPYARFQSVLTDEHTVQVGYDVARGEPRGKIGTTAGDCIDCLRCVVVCPTGIDIRQGYQLECIGCARCIDACDEIMARVEKPLGLIRYDSLRNLLGESTRILRPRVLIYSFLLVSVLVALGWTLGRRPAVSVAVLRPPGDPYAVLADGTISNHFTLGLHNVAQEVRTLEVVLLGPDSASLIAPLNPILLQGGQKTRMELFVVMPATELGRGTVPVQFKFYGNGMLLAERAAVFLGPATLTQ